MVETWKRLLALFRRDALDRDFEEELAAHVAMASDEHVRRGLSPQEARRRALIELGGLEAARIRHRDARGLPSLDGLLQDVRYAARTLRRSPGFTLTATLILALGIGINGAAFTVANAVLFKGFPHVDPGNRIVYVNSPGMVSYPDFEDWRARARSFEDMAVVSSGGLRYRLHDRLGASDTYDVTQLSANAFQLLGQRPILGRDFTAADEAPGAARVCILSHALWERRYAADPGIVGEIVRVNDRPTTVIGVMPAGFDFPHHRVQLWLPLDASASLRQRNVRLLWFAFGRMAAGATLDGVRAELTAIGQDLQRAHPEANRAITPTAWRFNEFYLGSDSAAFYGTVWGAVGFVLLIACANLTNLLLARTAGRAREMSIRLALGAERWRIVRQLLMESLLLSLCGGTLGWLTAASGVRAYQLLATPPGAYDRWDYAVDGVTAAYIAALSLLASVLIGLGPAFRLSGVRLNAALKDGGRAAGTSRGGRRIAATLVITETALAVVLLAGAGLLARSYWNFHQGDTGVDVDRLLTASAALPDAAATSPEAQIAAFDRLVTRIDALPGVASTALATAVPTYYATPRRLALAGGALDETQQQPAVPTLVVGERYFATVGARLRAGREFAPADNAAGMPAVIVNERFAQATWPNREAIGQRLRLFDGTAPGAWRTVVGVVSNVVQNHSSRGREFAPLVYLPFRQSPQRAMTVIARTSVAPASLADTFRQELHRFDADLIVGSGAGYGTGPTPLADTLAFSAWTKGVNGGLFALFAAVALLLASLGLYAVVAHAVSQRTQEIGVRTALGAEARDIVRLVLKEGMRPVGIGLCVGLAAALGLAPLLRSQLVQVSPADPLTLLVASAALLLSAALGCGIPARRAARVDPLRALRHE